MQSDSLQGMIDKLAKLPLLYQPGTRWVYSLSMDVQGYIVEKLSGQSLPEFMEQHIFKPLAMKDTGFVVPLDKRGRFATMYRGNDKGQMDTMPPGQTFGRGLRQDARHAVRRRWPRQHRAATTTALRRCCANNGQLNGVRVLVARPRSA